MPAPQIAQIMAALFWLKIPDNPGSLGIAISEAVEAAATSNGAKKYSLGSVLNHVLLHQTVIGEEALKQMDLAGEYPDIVHWLCRWRVKLRGHCLSVRARET
jgi:predicted alternative tryptophan synthase beta-subunit